MILSVRAQNGRCKSGWVGGIKISAVSPGAQYCGNKWDSTVAEQDVWGTLGTQVGGKGHMEPYHQAHLPRAGGRSGVLSVCGSSRFDAHMAL